MPGKFVQPKNLAAWISERTVHNHWPLLWPRSSPARYPLTNFLATVWRSSYFRYGSPLDCYRMVDQRGARADNPGPIGPSVTFPIVPSPAISENGCSPPLIMDERTSLGAQYTPIPKFNLPAAYSLSYSEHLGHNDQSAQWYTEY